MRLGGRAAGGREPHLSILRRWLGCRQLVFSILTEAFSSPPVALWAGSAWRDGLDHYTETNSINGRQGNLVGFAGETRLGGGWS